MLVLEKPLNLIVVISIQLSSRSIFLNRVWMFWLFVSSFLFLIYCCCIDVIMTEHARRWGNKRFRELTLHNVRKAFFSDNFTTKITMHRIKYYLYLVTYSPYRKMFGIDVVNLREVYILPHLILYIWWDEMYWNTRHNLTGASCKIRVIF
jgi:hypothetical protein